MGILLLFGSGGAGPAAAETPIVDRRRRGGVMPAPMTSESRIFHNYNVWMAPQLYKADTHHTNPATFDDDVTFGAIGLKTISEAWTEVTCSGATSTASIIPAGSVVFGVTARVTTAIEGATSWDLGHTWNTQAWGAGLAIAVGTTTSAADFSDYLTLPMLFKAADTLILTAHGGDFSAGVVKLVCHYYTLTAPAY